MGEKDSERNQESQNHRMVEIERDLWRSTGLIPPALAGPNPDGFWISLKKDTPQPNSVTCAQSPAQ